MSMNFFSGLIALITICYLICYLHEIRIHSQIPLSLIWLFVTNFNTLVSAYKLLPYLEACFCPFSADFCSNFQSHLPSSASVRPSERRYVIFCRCSSDVVLWSITFLNDQSSGHSKFKNIKMICLVTFCSYEWLRCSRIGSSIWLRLWSEFLCFHLPLVHFWGELIDDQLDSEKVRVLNFIWF